MRSVAGSGRLIRADLDGDPGERAVGVQPPRPSLQYHIHSTLEVIR
jgi:hypothetical protein